MAEVQDGEANLWEVIKGLCSEMLHCRFVDIPLAKASHMAEPTINGMER